MENIKIQARKAITELLEIAGARSGEIFVVGCSSSEITGGIIGKASSPDAALAVLEAIAPAIADKGLYLAAQCCEHLNRCLVIEREAAEKFGYDEVCVRPVNKAGGSFATAVFERMESPVVVESVRACAGLDIGGTLIGMHLKPVAVPVRLSIDKIGQAHIIAARTRPKLIGGSRAQYDTNLK